MARLQWPGCNGLAAMARLITCALLCQHRALIWMEQSSIQCDYIQVCAADVTCSQVMCSLHLCDKQKQNKQKKPCSQIDPQLFFRDVTSAGGVLQVHTQQHSSKCQSTL